MMKKSIPFLLPLAGTACGQSETLKPADVPTVEELAADPARLKELRQQCKTDRATRGDVLCNRAAEATNRRFFGDGRCLIRRLKNRPSFDRGRSATSPSFLVRHAAMRYCLRRFSLLRCDTHSVHLLDLFPDNSL